MNNLNQSEQDPSPQPLSMEEMKVNFSKLRHGGLTLLANLDMDRFHIVLPNKDLLLEPEAGLDGIDVEKIENRQIYNACSAVARDLRFADTKEIKDNELVDEIKEVIVGKGDLEFYVSYLLLTETYEKEQELGVEFSSLSKELGKYLLEVMVGRMKSSENVRDFEMVKDVLMRMTSGVPESLSGATYFGIGEHDDIWNAVKGREEDLGKKEGFGKVFEELGARNEEVEKYRKDHGVGLKE